MKKKKLVSSSYIAAMAILSDVENSNVKTLVEDLEEPFIQQTEQVFLSGGDVEIGSIVMVLLSPCVAVCGSFQFGYCIGYTAPTQSALRKYLNLTLADFSVFGSILNIGAITSGRIADFIGRKLTMRISACFCMVAWIGIFFSTDNLALDVARFFSGYGIGLFSYVVPVFIAEIAPKNLRGGLAALNQLLIVTGASFSLILGTVLSWRNLALTELVPCIIILAGLFFIPESPRWLANVGREKDFLAALQKLRGKDADISHEAAEIEAYNLTLLSLPTARLHDLIDQRYIRSVIIGVGLMVCQQFGGINGINFYASETFASAGLSSGNTGTLAFAIIQVPTTLVGALLMDRTGRKPLLMLSATGTFLGCLITAASFFLEGHSLIPGCAPYLAVSGVLVYIAAFSMGMGAGPWVIMSEIFPINMKGIAGSLVVLVNWSGAWAVSYTYNFLMSWSSTGTYMIYAGCCALTLIFVTKVVPEKIKRSRKSMQTSTHNSDIEMKLVYFVNCFYLSIQHKIYRSLSN